MSDQSFMERFGPRLVANGYPILPIMPGTKKPGRFRGGAWSDYPDWTRHAERPTSENELGVWSTWPDAGVGTVCGPVVGVDIDITDAEIALEIMAPVQPIRRPPGVQYAVDIDEDGADHRYPRARLGGRPLTNGEARPGAVSTPSAGRASVRWPRKSTWQTISPRSSI